MNGMMEEEDDDAEDREEISLLDLERFRRSALLLTGELSGGEIDWVRKSFSVDFFILHERNEE